MRRINTEEEAENTDIMNLKFAELKRTELTTGTNMLKQSRLHGINNDEVYQLFN